MGKYTNKDFKTIAWREEDPLPNRPEKNAMYIVKRGLKYEIIFTDNSGNYLTQEGGQVISEHNRLEGIQGGNEDTDEFYHLTKNERDMLIALGSNVEHPKYTSPTLDLNISNRLSEVGTQGIGTIKSVFIHNDAGPITRHRILKNNLEVSQSDTYKDTAPIALGETTYQSEANYLQGPIKNNKIGVPDPVGRIEAGVIRSPVKTIKGIIPWFWQTFSEEPTINTIDLALFNKVVQESTGTIRATLEEKSKYIVFVVPETSSIKKKWFSTELNRGDVGPGNFIRPPEKRSFDSPTLLWTGQTFNVYISDYLSDIKPLLELRNN